MTTETINAGQGTVISVGNGNNTVNVIGGSQDTISIGSGNNSLTVTGNSGGDTITAGNGNDAVTVTGGANNNIAVGNGNNSLTVTGNSGDTITAGNGNDTVTVTGGANNTITVGNGNVTVVASGDHNDAITIGNGNDTVYLGANDTLHMGKGSELVVLPSSTPALAVTPITVTEDQTVSLPGLGISAGLSAFGFGQENIYGFAAADQLEFTTAQFANFSAVMAAATQVGANTVITDASSDTITLENVAKSSLAAKNFVFVNGGSSSGSVLVTMTGLPSGLSNFNGGTYTASTGTWTGTAAQFDALTFKVGEETSAQLTVTATDTTTGFSISETIALTVTPPTITIAVNGVAQEGQTLAAAVTVSNGDAFTYQWQISSDGTHWINIAGANGMNYQVQEGDETKQLRVQVTLVDDGYAVASAATSPVLDAAPTVTTPTITGTAQEGQTLTAAASSGQSDNPVSYAWYSSADGFTNPIGTGSTYLVKEGDENHTIEVKATATNDNGAIISATSAATTKVLDNSSLALTVSVVASRPVQEGQTLVASAVPSDADDAGATVTYQWQSSSDNGSTWTNVAATAAGNFNNGVPSSFYQLTEGDEGKLFRATASFTDDTGQPVSATSAPTAAVADITPEITAPFSYAVDELSIVKTVNGTPTQIYDNTFSTAPPASPTILSSGVPTSIVFITQGSTWTESGGKAIASSTGVAQNTNIAGSVFDLALLDTNTDPTTPTKGLRLATDFTVSSTFDLTLPPTGSYGMELTDGTSTHGVDQLERLIVQRVNGTAVVELIQANLVNNNQQTVLASHTLTAAELANNTQIEFQMSHVANSTAVSGTFELINNGTVTSTTTFGPTASIFTGGVDWTRVDIGAFVNTGVGLNMAPGGTREGQTLTASATTNDSDATLHYQWQESSNNFTSFTVIGTDSASYVVQESDEGSSIRVVASTADPDNSQTTSVTSAVTGAVLDALPTVTTPTITGTAQEGQTLTASASSGQADNPVSYAWYSSADGFTSQIGSGATYLVSEGNEGSTIEVKATATNDNGVTVTATSAATSAVLDAAPTVTTPVITGTAQEGQTLTASASSGQADNPVSYAWYSSADGFTGQIGTGSTYVVKETDEGFTIEAKATATNDNGATISATSAATSGVLDAAPTVTTPTITGTAQEGQTLTASASSGQSDNAVSYGWYSSADNYTNPIGTGSTYLVKEGDENATIEVKATATNDNGATASATSAATANVLDDSSLSLSVSVVSNGSVQQGQTLVASATPGGDADDANATVTYQWQSSSDNGQTWSAVTGALAGNFNNGVPSSFYQLTEGDEGKQFRATASFTDDTGQVVTTTSAPTVKVADVTPEITVPFSYAVDELSIVKNGTQIYDNTFSQAPPASPTILSNTGVPTPIVFITQGSTWTEAGGKAIASSTGVAPNPNVSGSTFDLALLDTNTDSTNTKGLKEGADFTVSSTFDLVVPPTGSYGMELTDGTSTHGNDQLERLIVQRVNGNAVVELIQANLTTNTQTVVAQQTLTAAELAGNNEISFQFSHAANATVGTGTFELIHNGTVTSTTTFAPQVTIFTPSVDWTRVDIGAFTNPGVGLNMAPGGTREGQTLTASATTNDSDATLHYQWQESSNNFTSFTVIGTDSASYVVQEADEGSSIRVVASTTDPDNSQTTSVTSAVTGAVLDALPTVTTPTITGTAQEGQTLTASASSGQADNPVSYAWYSSADGFTSQIGTGSTYLVSEGNEGSTIEVKATTTNDNGVTVTATSAATSAVLDAAPTVTTPVITGTAQEGQTLTASASSGQADNQVSYAWYSSADNYTNAIGSGATYLVAEGNEGATIEVVATATNDNGATISATSAATPAVLDAAPTVTTPTITGTAQEGQTLTASASSGQSDNAVSYGWYSSADNYTNPIGTGSTYQVKEADENHTIEVKATATNDNGVTISATSTATASVTDNASLSLTVKDLTGGAVAQGHVMVASATITGDADDAATPVTYQWQSSSDGGATWTNVAATTSGLFGGVLSSFYQLGEQDEGNIFQIVASFTDDTGQVVTATSAPTAPVADIAPIVTQPFSFALDEFKVVKGASTFDDTFTQGPPPVGGFFGSNLVAFNTNNGAIVPELNGKAILTAAGSTPNATLASTDSTGATLLTNTQPQGTGLGQSEGGLKEDQTFTFSGTYDLAAPGIATYGIELLNESASGNTQVVQLVVQAGSGGTNVNLYETNLATGVHTLLTGQALTAAQMANNTQIELDLAHSAANSQTIAGSFELFNNGTQTLADTFSTTATEFASTTFVQAAVFASSPPSVAITGTAQEGQTLTAVAVTNDSDATINYQWMENNGPGGTYQNIAGATGATYVVQEADENFKIEVVATTTNDNGQTASATSAPTADVIDNASISLSMSVVGNGAVQQGQTLVASATPSDADDAGATVTYQWQSSSDSGATWTNVGGDVAGNFNNGVPSSFYQLTEGDEGKLFRATASFTDDTGQLVSATSAPTVAVADVTPEITVPFSYAVDELSIVKTVNGTPTQIYDNTFSQAPAASPTILSSGVPTPIVFITQGSTWSESGGKAIASSAGVAANPNISGSTFDLALLNTNTDPASTSGLKLGADFTVSSTFDLTAPPTGSYGMELTDGTSTHAVDQLVRMIVTRSNGETLVELVQRDLTANPQTNIILASQDITAALAANSQIEFQLSHVANSTAITGSFALGNGGSFGTSTTFSPTATIFTNGVNWTRVDVGAFTNAGVGLNLGAGQSPREGQTLTASATTNDSDATLHYQWQNSSDGSTWSNISAATGSTYVVQEADESLDIRVVASTTDADNSQTTSATSVTTGPVLDALPTVTTPIIGGTAQEGQTLTASASSGQSDNPVTYAWYSSTDGYTNPIGSGATYLVKEGDEGFTIEAKATATNDNGVAITATSAATAAVLDAAPTVTTPVIAGSAQEGQTLTASASSGQSDNPVTYAWYSSADNYTNPIGTGANYVVKEGDEGATIEVTATATNENNVTTSATSAATSAVLDAAPTVTTPTITGTAQEGQTLTASASSGQSDNAVSYAWYSSADGYTNPIGSGSTYLVKEGDENATIEVKATATNDNGTTASATSAATTKVLDNSSLSLSVSVVAGGTVQQGQTLVASAIPSDADDATAAVTYQWQSSSDNGATWTNVAATAAGGFGNTVPSSFYQLTEGDEGKLFRATASFTDDTGQLVSATSAPTVAVADVTPEITVPFSYAVDELSIVKTVNGTPTQIYDNTFSQAPPASPTILSSGVPTPIVFITQGSTWTESGGKAIASSTGVAANPNISGSTFDLALLNTNTDPASTSGLKLGADFTVSSTFDLTAPPTGSYGMELTDGTSTHAVDQLVRMIVTRSNGETLVELVQRDLTANPQTNIILASQDITAALATNSQIEFQLSHVANSTAITGSFALGNGGSFGTPTTFSPTATIFTNGVNWTRVDVGAFTNAGVGLNLGAGQSPREGQTLTASATTNDSDATLHYQWQNSSDGSTWSNISAATGSSYVVQEADEGLDIRVVASTTDADNSQTTSATSVTTGPVLDALPTVTTPTITGTAQEGQTLTASASSGQADNPVTYAWYSSTDGYTNSIGSGATYLVKEGDEGFTIEAKATATNGNGVTVSAFSAATAAVLDAAPTVTTPTITGTAQEGQTLTASASSAQGDNAVSYAWYSSADGYANPIGSGATYAVKEADEGKTIEAKATATNDNGVTTTATSAATAAVTDITLAFTTAASISGTAQEGQVLTAVNGSLNDSDAAVTGYQWTRDGGNISGATSASYAVTDTDEAHVLAVVETATDGDGGPAATSTSAATTSVAGTAEAPLLNLASNFVTLTYPGAGPSGNGTFAYGINNAGAIVGGAATDSQHTTGWEYVNGTFSAVGVAGAQDNNADGITDSGAIAGFYSPVRSTPRYGFIDTNGSYSQINVSPPGISTTANGINDSGVIVGASYLKNGTVYTGFIDNGGTFTFLNAPGTSTSVGYTNAGDINNAGEVVGTYNTNYNSGNAWQGFTYLNGTYTTIDDPNGTEGTFANGINNSGEIVGDYTDSSGKQHGFINVGGTFYTIDDPLGTGGTVLTGINDVGQIVGYYQDSSGIYHGFEASFQDSLKVAQNTSSPLTVTLTASDSDDALSMTLNVLHGTVTLGTITGLTITGNGSATLSFSGSQSNINADLGTLRYTPASGYSGSDTLSIHGTATEANGNAATTTQSLGITVAPNLIVNGGFETGTTTGWTITNGGSLGNNSTSQTGVDTGGTSHHTPPISPHSGTHEMHLGQAGSNEMLDQNVTTVAGATYRIDFFLANDGGTPNNFSASFGGATLMSLVNTPYQNWTEYTFYKVATGTSTDLNFTARQDPDFWFLDDVSVVDPDVAASDSTIVQTGPAPSVFDNAGSLTVADGTSMALSDVVDNTGSIALSGQSAATGLVIGDQAVLEGGGTISLSDSALNSITGNGTDSELSNVDNTIVGSGEIGGGGLSLVNKSGLIEATGVNPLVIDTGSNNVINTGTLEANGGSLIVKSAVTGGGNAVIAGGTLEFAAAADNNVSFSGSNLGILALDQSQNFTGTVAGFGGQDQIDLGDIGFAAGSTLGYAANSDNSGGTLTVSDGTITASIALLGQYMASSFATASDGHGGTLITQAPAVAQDQLAQSHA